MKFVLEHREDIWRLPPDTRILAINCKIDEYDARELLKKCIELERIEFSPHAKEESGEAIFYHLRNAVETVVRGKTIEHTHEKEVRKTIRELWNRGDHDMERLARKFNISVGEVYHIVHEKAPKHAKEEENG